MIKKERWFYINSAEEGYIVLVRKKVLHIYMNKLMKIQENLNNLLKQQKIKIKNK